MLWPKKNSYKEFDNEKKFLWLENSPPPPPPPHPPNIELVLIRDFPEVKFSSEYCTETLLCYLFAFLLPFIVLLQNKHTTLAENGENLISA